MEFGTMFFFAPPLKFSIENHENPKVSVSEPEKAEQVIIDPSNDSPPITKDTKPKKYEKPLHLHHDLNQLCFEKRERKNVDRFGIGRTETGIAGKAKKERVAKEKEGMGKAEKKEKNGKGEKGKKAEKIKKNEEKMEKTENGKEETMKLETNGNLLPPNIANEEKKQIKDFREKLTNEINEIIEITEKTEKNGEIPGNHDLKQKTADFIEVNEEKHDEEEKKTIQSPVNLLIDPIEPSKPTDLLAVEPNPVLKKTKPHKNPLGLLRKRGRKKKAKWGNSKNSFDGGSSSLGPTSSLNKIFKKGGGTGGRRPAMAKKVPFSASIFANTYKELFLGNGGNEVRLEVQPILEKGSIIESGVTNNNNGHEEEKKDLMYFKNLPSQ